MKLNHTVVALNASGQTLKEIMSTLDLDKARSTSGELSEALAKRQRRIRGELVAGYEVVSEPM